MKLPRAGLLTAGGVSKSFIARMPALLRSLGPVKAGPLRVARRISNSLRAGYAVEGYAALGDCDLLWIAIPETAIERVLTELATEIPVRAKMVVICGSARGSLALGALHGARAATLNAIPGEEATLVGEGDAAALREIRKIAKLEKRKLIEIAPAAKPSFLAGVHSASDLLLAHFGAAVEILRGCGFSRAEATWIAEGLGSRALRAYAKAGRKAWSSATALHLRHSRERDLVAIRRIDARCAALYQNAIEQALAYFGEERLELPDKLS